MSSESLGGRRHVDGDAMRTIVLVLLNLLVVTQHARLTASAKSTTVLHCEGEMCHVPVWYLVKRLTYHQKILPLFLLESSQ